MNSARFSFTQFSCLCFRVFRTSFASPVISTQEACFGFDRADPRNFLDWWNIYHPIQPKERKSAEKILMLPTQQVFLSTLA
ncbi:hypothetical protein ARMSODRAFT_66359 [Armillaria solidipes]|uniref:Uncharacterized protein n=1 Tax=Armillaria solidipes TaxID=1076256 RepID=A0A2H3C4Y9_9AGAR|nr:hypothetical protein ARMSODRAFT_66359 [Armillaria solidipes]